MSNLHTFKVGIMSGVASVESPSAPAAALFYGLAHSTGAGILLAVVYEMDGEPFEGDRFPWGKYLGHELTDEEYSEFINRMEEVRPELSSCKFLTVERGMEE